MGFNFEQYAGEGNIFINEVAELTGFSRDKAARITQVVLHALRDRLQPADAVSLGQALPVIIRGIYYDQLNLSQLPQTVRGKEAFINFIHNKLSEKREFDRSDILKGLQAVTTVLKGRLSPEYYESIMREINEEIRELIDQQ
ncbi:DUF2267 domain-containing protein [Nitrosomonas communis]|uniref:DUF2267 domain-containing protein n=1 Tax=Nitrosomonas communis TaxID=44574 RepID=UPI003D269217